VGLVVKQELIISKLIVREFLLNPKHDLVEIFKVNRLSVACLISILVLVVDNNIVRVIS
jgi:hypothetical protein